MTYNRKGEQMRFPGNLGPVRTGSQMMRGFAIAALGSMLLSGAAIAQDAAKWGQVGGWAIRVDRSVGNGCFALQVYDNGTIIRLGFNMDRKAIYLMLGNQAWNSLEVGKRYRMSFVFDGVDRYNGELVATALANGTVLLDHDNVSADFTKAFMERNTVQIYYQGSRIGNFSLSNTYAAITEVVNCQRELAGSGGGGQSVSDPFQRGGTRSDPFSR